jgi:hypothetical protein
LCGVKTRGLPHPLLGHERSAKAGNASDAFCSVPDPYRYPDPDRIFHLIPDPDPTLNQGHVKKCMFIMGLDFKAFVISIKKVPISVYLPVW